MHMLKTYDSLREKLEREVAEINKGELSEKDVQNLYYMTKTLKNLCCLIDEERMYEDGYSNGYYNDGHSYRMMPHMSNGRYGRDGDGDGRYGESSNATFRYSNANYSNRGWNGEGGYSRDNARQKMTQKLETLKDDTMSEKERQAIDNCIRDINM